MMRVREVREGSIVDKALKLEAKLNEHDLILFAGLSAFVVAMMVVEIYLVY